jgi:hypothetical protein
MKLGWRSQKSLNDQNVACDARQENILATSCPAVQAIKYKGRIEKYHQATLQPFEAFLFHMLHIDDEALKCLGKPLATPLPH